MAIQDLFRTIAEGYRKILGFFIPMRMNRKEITKFIKSYLKKGDFVLDVGCGKGDILKDLKNQQDIVAFGIDPVTRVEDEEINFRKLKAERIGKMGGTFDLIFSVYSFHHLDNPEKFLGRAKRKLRTGGRLITIDWTPEANVPFRERYYNSHEMTNLHKKAGFEITKESIKDDTQIYVSRVRSKS